MRYPAILFIVFFLTLLPGCNPAGNGAAAGGSTLAGHGVELPDGLAAKIPFPAEANVRTKMVRDDTHIIMYSPGLSYPDALAFFSESLHNSDWTIDSEYIPERKEGERESRWQLSGHGAEVSVSVSAFGGEQGFNMSGIVSVKPGG